MEEAIEVVVVTLKEGLMTVEEKGKKDVLSGRIPGIEDLGAKEEHKLHLGAASPEVED